MKRMIWLFVFVCIFSFLSSRVTSQSIQSEPQENEIQLVDFEDSGEPDFKANNF